MDLIEQLLEGIYLPKMMKIQQGFDAPTIENVPNAVHQALHHAHVLSRIKEGDRVAIAVGSRGVADIPLITRELVRAVKNVRAQPFIVPAMGSHGGATAEGQKKVLEELGVTESSVGAPIRSSIEVVQIGELENGLPTGKNGPLAARIQTTCPPSRYAPCNRDDSIVSARFGDAPSRRFSRLPGGAPVTWVTSDSSKTRDHDG